MHVEQLYTKCLAEAAYYIESEGEAVIIDPLRETTPYTNMLEERKSTLKYILETHFHADFVSGHIDLAKETGATIVYGPMANPAFEAHIAEDGEVLKVGKLTIKVLHTPGHTMESSTYLLIDENGNNHSIYTGDTLFIGDVGRPDLAVKSDLTEKDLAGLLYDSLHNKILPLEDTVMVYPGHGQGSACGKSMSKETFDTLGNQKKVNYALRSVSKEKFIQEVTEGLTQPPQYFPKNVMLNKEGYTSYNEVMQKGNTALSIDEFESEINNKALILDTRKPAQFAEKHVPNSIFIGLDGSFASWAGTLIENLETPILLVVEAGREKEAITRLSRVGYDNVIGYLKDGIAAWKASGREIQSIRSIPAVEFEQEYRSREILDVRKPSEFETRHVKGAINYPLDYIMDNLDKIDSNKEYYIHCAGGYRSLVATSILMKNGAKLLTDIAGGYNAIKETNIPLVSEELIS